MTDEQLSALTSKWQERTAGSVVSIEKIDKTFVTGTHPFTIGPQHVAYASDHCSGMLSEEVTEKIGCAHRGCGQKGSDPVHKPEVACYIRITRPSTQKEVTEVLVPIKDEMNADGISGFAFVNHTEVTDWGK